MNILSDRIKKERENLELTRDELGQKLGVSYSAIAMYEQGNREPNKELLLKMCELFNCTTDYLIGKSEFKNYEEYKEMDDYVLNYALTQGQEDATLIANTLNYINTHKNEDPDEIIKKSINSLPLERQNDLSSIISHLHNRYHSLLPQKTEENNIKQNKTSSMFMIPILGKIAAGQPILADEYLEGYLPIDPNMYGMTSPDDYFYLKISGDSMNLKVQDGDYVLIHKQDCAESGDIIAAIVNGDNEATLKRYKEINEQFIQLEPMSSNPIYENRTIDLKETKFQVIGKAIGKFGKF